MNGWMDKWMNEIARRPKANHPPTGYTDTLFSILWPWPWPDDPDIRTGHSSGFSLNRALFRKNVWAPHLGPSGVTPIFHEKKLATFFSSSLSLLFISLVCCKKFAAPLVGPLFVGPPVRPNMLNMPNIGRWLDVDIQKMDLHAKNELSRPRLSKVRA